MRAAISKLIDTLPSVSGQAHRLLIPVVLTSIALFQIEDMKKHLDRKVTIGKSKPKLREIDPSVSPAAWLILRW